MRDDVTFLGTVVRVEGATVHVEVWHGLPSTSPIINGRIHRIGQIGTFVRLPLGFLNVFGIVSSVGVATMDDERPEYAIGQRMLVVELMGEALGTGTFERGVSEYPTLDDEVHIVTEADLSRIYKALNAAAPIKIGTHAASESLPAVIDLDRLVTRHCAIVGSTGSGKSNTVAGLLKALAIESYPSARIVVIDPHGEYGSAFGGMSRVLRIGDATSPLVIPYWALSFDELAWFLVDRRSASETAQDTKLRDLIYDKRREFAPKCTASQGQDALAADEITADSPIPFSVTDLWYELDREERKTWSDQARTKEAIIAEGDPSKLKPAQFQPPGAGSTLPHKNAPIPSMAASVARMNARLRDRRFAFMLDPYPYDGATKDLHDLVADWIDHDHAITVLDLAGMPSEVTDLVVGLITRILFETMFWGRDMGGLGRQRPLLMVYEEAHSYLPRAEGQFIQGYARRSIQRVFKEGRKYGIGAVVVSQRPSDLDETVLSQCGTFVALRLTNSQDQARVAALVPDEVAGLTKLLPALRTGESLVVGEAIAIPSRVRIDLVSPRPDSGDPDVSGRWSAQEDADAELGKAITAWRRQRKPNK